MLVTSQTIFYFSGTGNSLQVANDLKETLDENYLIQPISELKSIPEVLIDSECVGIVFPVYMLGIPLLVADFIKKLRYRSTPYIFAIATYGGNVGKSFTQINELLSKSSQKLSSEFSVKMPGNNILLYGANPIAVQQRLFKEEIVRVTQIADTIGARHNTSPTAVPLLMKLIAPIAYKKLENHYGSIPTFKSTEVCNGCGLCQKVCCVDNIRIIEKHPIWESHCQQCMACIQHCPKVAINYGSKTIGRTRYKNPNVKTLSQK